MKKRIVTKVEQRIVTALYDENQLKSISILQMDSILHNIYVAKVANVVPNIHAAFLDIGLDEEIYYSLDQNKDTIFLTPKKKPVLSIGDLILVQIDKPSMKTKQPSGSCYLSIAGFLCAATYKKTGVGISAKIRADKRREELTHLLEPKTSNEIGFVLRTASKDANNQQIIEEALSLKEQLETILSLSQTKMKGSLVYKAPTEFDSILQQDFNKEIDQIVTDDTKLYEIIKDSVQLGIERHHIKHDILTLSSKELPLSKLYPLEKDIKSLLKPKVWLKSGGYLVIEPTEALTVIDVNTGKAIGKGQKESFLFELNKEAAIAIARQIELRNLSGIILIDFINMKEEQQNKQLLSFLQKELDSSSVKTNVIDITKLGLVEVTRKKRLPSFSWQWEKNE